MDMIIGALLLTITHLGLIFIGAVCFVISRRRKLHIIGGLFMLSGAAGIFFSIYHGLVAQAGMAL